MISEAAIADLKVRNPCDKVASRWVKLRRKGKKMIGPCPLHSRDPAARDSTSFECDAEGWVCAVCSNGGDCLKLLMLVENCDFPRAVEILGGTAEPSSERTAELEREQSRRREQNEKAANSFREQERRTAFEIWHAGVEIHGSPAQAYLQARGITDLPDRPALRFAPEIAYFHGDDTNELGRKSPRVVYRGPAMLAAIVEPTGKFRAVHITWIDVAHPGHKATIKDPDSGEALPAKKVRGSKSGNVIRLHHISERPHTLILGEGIETVLSVWYAMREDFRRNNDPLAMVNRAFWSGVDLGNIAGKANDSVPHPSLKDAAGRTRRVPGPDPDLTAPGIAIPDSITDIVLLGDGDSDRFTTQCALARATRRFALNTECMTAIGRTVRCAWADEGKDFNDLLRAAA